jgi:hypothetical protein
MPLQQGDVFKVLFTLLRRNLNSMPFHSDERRDRSYAHRDIKELGVNGLCFSFDEGWRFQRWREQLCILVAL